MKIDIINSIDIDCLESAISKAGDFYCMAMNDQTCLQLSCNSHGKCVSYMAGEKTYTRYLRHTIAIDNTLPYGHIVFLKEC